MTGRVYVPINDGNIGVLGDDAGNDDEDDAVPLLLLVLTVLAVDPRRLVADDGLLLLLFVVLLAVVLVVGLIFLAVARRDVAVMLILGAFVAVLPRRPALLPVSPFLDDDFPCDFVLDDAVVDVSLLVPRADRDKEGDCITFRSLLIDDAVRGGVGDWTLDDEDVAAAVAAAIEAAAALVRWGSVDDC
jgi:hypothetical protein